MKRWFLWVTISFCLAAPLAAQTITGTVFRDYNANGSCDSTGGTCDGSLEPGIAGVRVDAFDAAGAAAGDSPRTTAADGTFTLSGVSGTVRLELTLPGGAGLGFLAPGAAGPSTVAFAAAGDRVEVGFNNPADYCQANPRFVVACFTNGDPLHPTNVAEPVIVSFEYDDEGDDTSLNRDKQTEVAQASLGPVWGLAYDRDRQLLYSAAVLKRHVGLGPGGIGAIYRTNLATGVTDASPFFDFGAGAGVVLDNATRFSTPAGSGSTPDRFGDNIDPSTFGQAATVGFGDLELSEDGATLFVTNLADRIVYRLNTSGAISASAIPGAPWLATSPGGGTARPWGLDVQDGLLYVGVVADEAPLAFQVYIWDGSTWSTAFASPVPLTYQRQLSDRTPDATDFWRPWTFVYTGSEVDANASTTPANIDYAIPQALLADLEVEPGGIMTLGFMDRGGLQYGYETPEPDDTNAGDIDISYWPAGDTLRATRSGSNWVIENGVGGSGASPFGPGGREFFDDIPDWVGGSQTAFFSHDIGAGGLLMRKGSGEVATTSSDQVRPFSGSMAFFDLADGSADRSLEVFLDTTSTDFSKAGGLGDMELLCAPAPIQIGNRVWCDDIHRNGVQDPGEAGINGITVSLDCGVAGSATTVTAGDGNYLFSALGANPIPPGATCTLAIDPSTMPGFPSGCVDPAFANVGSPSDPGSDLRDNDAVPVASRVEIPVSVGGPGANDHSYDFGFRTPPQPLLTAIKSDAVPIAGDADGDGQLDGGDTLKYTVTITNLGDGDATAATFTSAIDAATSLVVGSVMTSQGSVTSGNTAGDTSVAIDLGDVAAAGTVTVMFSVTLANPIPDGVDEVVCQGLLSSSNHPPISTDDPDTGNPTDSTDTPVDAAPEVSATKVDALLLDGDFDGRADAGDTVRYTVVVRNDGDASALDVAFASAVDANTGLVVGSVTTSQGTVTTGNSAGDTSVAVDIGSVAGAGGTVTITFDVTVDSPLPAGADEATCQGLVTGSNIPTTPTDDPDDPTGDDDPTDTPLDLGEDFGDAPDSYTTSASPSHRLDSTAGIYLGACVDSEAGGQPAPAGTAADGDDANDAGPPAAILGTCVGDDDEDGVAFDTMLIACSMAQITVTSAGNGNLDAWIDFDRDGQFDHPAERIIDDRALTGSDTIQFLVPCTASAGATYARFRASSAGGLTPTGSSDDGEVEDYQVTLKGVDFGDAPDSYGTTAGTGGASHGVDPTSPFYLGACVDTEGDGQPAATAGDPASGDDSGSGTATVGACAIANDDEDGVTFDSMVVACGTADLTVTANAAGVLDAWLDFDGDGAFQGDERILAGQALAAGANALSFAVPCDASAGSTYARFRLSSAGVATPTGTAMDGEVEDYEIATKGLDLGDAPDSYGTTAGAGGASHVVDPASTLYLGACVDTEADGQPAATFGDPATGDDSSSGLATLGTCAGNDDEDGITFDSMIVACGTADITVTANAAGVLDAWIDFDGDGVFQGDERIFTAQALPAGANALSFAVPCDATAGTTYARFRLSSAGIATPGGAAMDGEIEDYRISAKGLDLGDAPDSYGTTAGAGGASHVVDSASTLYLGACVDTEADGQPAAAFGDPATGDDTAAGLSEVGTCVGNDDEDGVTFDSMVIACGSTDLTVVASQAGLLDAWLDFDADGVFQGDEQIFTAQALAPGSTPLSFAVPCDATTGTTYARFRVSSAGGLGPDGPAMDGEVEDYELAAKGLDLGDAPDSYGTTVAANGARHGVDPAGNLYLGACVDTETDGQPVGPGADGDDLGAGLSTVGTCAGNDDEDGVSFDSMVIACASADVTVTVGAGGLLAGWVDFDADGAFQADEQVFADQAVAGGGNALSFAVPCDAAVGDTYARFRLSSAGGLGPQGLAMDGEIEDYRVAVQGVDFGDAPLPYPTLIADDGARHVVAPTANPTLGAAVDTEPDGVPSASHMGDDLAGSPDDEDGVSDAGVLVPGTNGTVTVTAGTTGGLLDAWIDFNADGDWNDPGEQIATSLALAAGTSVDLTFAVPAGSPMGSTCSRYRISSAGGLTPTGLAMDGEIEDYLVALGAEDPILGVAKRITSLERTDGAIHIVVFEIQVDNLGNVPLSAVQVEANLADAFAEAVGFTVLDLTSADLTVNPEFDGDTDPRLLSGTDSLGVGESATLELTVELDPGSHRGPYVCSSTGTASSPEGTEVMDVSQDGPDSDPDVNGDPRDNDVPTVFEVTISVLEIPTVGEVGLLLLISLLMLAGCGMLRRRASDL